MIASGGVRQDPQFSVPLAANLAANRKGAQRRGGAAQLASVACMRLAVSSSALAASAGTPALGCRGGVAVASLGLQAELRAQVLEGVPIGLAEMRGSSLCFSVWECSPSRAQQITSAAAIPPLCVHAGVRVSADVLHQPRRPVDRR